VKLPTLVASDEELESALLVANIPTLLMVLIQLTGDRRWLGERYRPTRTRAMDDNTDGGLPTDVLDEIRTGALAALRQYREGREVALPRPGTEQLVEMMSGCMGEPVADEYVPMLMEEMGLVDRDTTWRERLAPHTGHPFEVLIIGAGFAGVCAAIKLGAAGISHTIVEKNDDLGGSWLENTYPGCRVDTPSHLYSYSFAPDPDWSSYYALRDETHAYLRRCAESTGVASRIRFGTEVLAADYDTSADVWTVRLRTADGREQSLRVNAVISAVGQLNRPKIPTIRGLDTFAGPAFHSADWDHEVDIDGRRIAVVGTGASAMQIVPAIADRVGRLTVFQRSPQWAAPSDVYKAKVPEGKKLLLAQVPYYAGWYRFRLLWTFNDKIYYALQIDPEWPHPDRSINAANDRYRQFFTNYIRSEIGGREALMEKVLPTYPPFGKRILLDNGWFRTMARDDVDLVVEDIAEVRPEGIVTADGELHEVDVIVFATGFHATRFLWPMEVRGRSGRTLRETWGEDDARAHLGINIPDFPGLFCLYGPNTNLGHGGSVIFHIECQVRYVMGLIGELMDRGASTVEVREDVHDAYVQRVDAAHDRMIWTHKGMDVWYRNANGRVVNNSPWRLVDYWAMTRTPNPEEFHWRGTPGCALSRSRDESSDLRTGGRRPTVPTPNTPIEEG